jgi:glycogen(starch) synthase
MRVLFWSLTFWPTIGGLEVLSSKLLPSLRQRGYEFLVVTPKNHTDLPDEEHYQGIPIRRLGFQSPLPSGIDHLVEVRRQFVTAKRRFAPDLIHINGVGAMDFFHLSTAQAHKAPMVVTLHNPWPSRTDMIVAQTLRAADWVVGVSAAILERAHRLAPEVRPCSSVIYNAVPPPLPPPRPLPFVQPRLLCLGRLAPEKGMDVAIRAFRLILERFPRARLTIAGDGPLRFELEEQALRDEVRHAVDFMGWVLPEKVLSLINDHTMVLMPSREEPFGLVALEAALMARPVVATRVGGLPEIVVHEQTGLLVEKDDRQSLAEAAALLLSKPEIAAQFGHAARHRAQELFSWEQHIAAYDALYRQIESSFGDRNLKLDRRH